MGPAEFLEKLAEGIDPEFEIVDVRYSVIIGHKETGIREMDTISQGRLNTLNNEVGPLNWALSMQNSINRKIVGLND